MRISTSSLLRGGLTSCQRDAFTMLQAWMTEAWARGRLTAAEAEFALLDRAAWLQVTGCRRRDAAVRRLAELRRVVPQLRILPDDGPMAPPGSWKDRITIPELSGAILDRSWRDEIAIFWPNFSSFQGIHDLERARTRASAPAPAPAPSQKGEKNSTAGAGEGGPGEEGTHAGPVLIPASIPPQPGPPGAEAGAAATPPDRRMPFPDRPTAAQRRAILEWVGARVGTGAMHKDWLRRTPAGSYPAISAAWERCRDWHRDKGRRTAAPAAAFYNWLRREPGHPDGTRRAGR